MNSLRTFLTAVTLTGTVIRQKLTPSKTTRTILMEAALVLLVTVLIAMISSCGRHETQSTETVYVQNPATAEIAQLVDQLELLRAQVSALNNTSEQEREALADQISQLNVTIAELQAVIDAMEADNSNGHHSSDNGNHNGHDKKEKKDKEDKEALKEEKKPKKSKNWKKDCDEDDDCESTEV